MRITTTATATIITTTIATIIPTTITMSTTTTSEIPSPHRGEGQGEGVVTSPLFDSYIMVDWSARSKLATGKDSIWLCQLRRDAERIGTPLLKNPPTRLAARDRILELIRSDVSQGRSVLVGFDFPFGYPHGFAACLRLAATQPWRATWKLLAESIREGSENLNNRFQVAAQLNERICGAAAPFWGCHAAAASAFLASKDHDQYEALHLRKKRIAESRIPGPQPVWKLNGAGSVGGQALTGIPIVHYLRNHVALMERSCVWPFETGLKPPRRQHNGSAVFAEIYPSIRKPVGHDVKDAAQVLTLAQYFADLDSVAQLGPLFVGDSSLSAVEREWIEQEEAWILGVTGPPQVQVPVDNQSAPPPHPVPLPGGERGRTSCLAPRPAGEREGPVASATGG